MLIEILGSNVAIVAAFHRLPAGFVLPDSVINAVHGADKVVFERDLTEQLIWPGVGRLSLEDVPDHQIPENLLSLWTGPAVRRPIADLEQRTIGKIASTIYDAISTHTFKLEFAAGVDWQLWNIATPNSRTFVETSETIIPAMSVYPDEEQLQDLIYACNIQRQRTDFLSELAAWTAGDYRHLGTLTDTIYLRTPKRAEAMLSCRNEKMWAGLTADLHTKANSVHVLGAAHVVGAHGLLNRIEAAGHRFEVR